MSRRLEIGALLALCFFLPLYEAPKSIFWALYVVVWVVNRVRARDFGGRWDGWDSLFAAWIGSGFVVAAFAGLAGGDEWRGALDLLRYGALGWIVKRSPLDEAEVRRVLGALVLSTLIGLAGGLPDTLGHMGVHEPIKLNSVGHENHTAIYVAIMLGVCVSWLLAGWRSWSRGSRAVALAVTLLVLLALIHSASRGAIAVGLLVPVVLALGWWARSRLPLLAMACALAVTGAAMLAGGSEAVRKHEANLRAHNVLAFRGEIWDVALATWREHPWFGVGMDNFSRANPYRKPPPGGKDVNRALKFGSHGHSLYFNTLAERGIVGSVALGAFLVSLGFALFLRRPRPASSDTEWLLWGCAVAAWAVTLGVGAVNTTLHHEHGILATLLFGLWLSKRPAR